MGSVYMKNISQQLFLFLTKNLIKNSSFIIQKQNPTKQDNCSIGLPKYCRHSDRLYNFTKSKRITLVVNTLCIKSKIFQYDKSALDWYSLHLVKCKGMRTVSLRQSIFPLKMVCVLSLSLNFSEQGTDIN